MNRILVVSDEESIRMLYSEELLEEAYEVIETGDTSQVFALIAKNRPDLVLMDIRFDPLNGVDLLQDLRKTYHDLPVVLCGGYPSFQYDLKSIAAVNYVVRSSKVTDLKLKIRKAFEGAEALSPVVAKNIDGIKTEPMKQMKIPW